MFDFSAAREQMVECQIRTADVTDYSVLSAFRNIPRELFVPKSASALAYSDTNINLDSNRVMLAPRTLAKMIQAAEVEPTDIVLDIACGRGYSSAILARLAETVVALEEDAETVDKATAALSDSGADNAVVVQGDIKVGASEHGPFDVIFVNGAVETVPQNWFSQLAENGRLVLIEEMDGVGRAVIYSKNGAGIGHRVIFDASAPILNGMEREKAFAF